MEHVSVIVRNTFIEVERTADSASARRSSSLPHTWRFQDYDGSLISACTRLATTSAVDQTKTIQSNSQSAANSSMSTAPTSGKVQKPLVPQGPAAFHTEGNDCATRLNALDLFVPWPKALRRAGTKTTRVSQNESTITARSSNLRSRSRSANSNRSRCSGDSLGTKTTGCGSGSETGTSDTSGLPACADSPSNAVVDSVTPLLLPADVSGSRRSRRRRAAARKAAEQAQLRIHAPVFNPVAPPPQQTSPFSNEMMDVVSAAQSTVLSCPHVSSVQVVKPVSEHSRVTSIVISFHPSKVWAHDVRTLAKNAFLEAAEKSQQVFILGYGVEPFVEENHDGFTATIGSVPVDCQQSVCWDFWQKGFCQRLSTCRWCHPVSSDLMDVRFVFAPAQVPVQQPAPVPVQQLHSFWTGPGCHVDSWCVPASCWVVYSN